MEEQSVQKGMGGVHQETVQWSEAGDQLPGQVLTQSCHHQWTDTEYRRGQGDLHVQGLQRRCKEERDEAGTEGVCTPIQITHIAFRIQKSTTVRLEFQCGKRQAHRASSKSSGAKTQSTTQKGGTQTTGDAKITNRF